MLPFQSLVSVTATGEGAALDIGEGDAQLANAFSVQLSLSITASGSWSVTCGLEGSLDGTDFSALPINQTSSFGLSGSGLGSAAILVGILPVWYLSNGNFGAVIPYVRYVRINFAATTGSISALTLSGWVAAVEPYGHSFLAAPNP